jgi:hypothetical protein
VLAEHDHVENLPAYVQMRAEHGVIPITIPLPAAANLATGRSSSVITHEYQPRYPEIIPAGLQIDVMDPDSGDYMSLAEELAETPEDMRLYMRLRQKVAFQDALLIRMMVHLSLPLNPERPNVPRLGPVVRRVTIDWPTITSLSTTELEAYGTLERGGERHGPKWWPFPVRYNPVDRRLEWEKLGMGEPAENGDGGRARTIDYNSPPMRLLIEHPDELYGSYQLKVSAEIEIPGYLMSGLEPRLFDATGREIPRSTEMGREPLPALTTRVTVNGTLVVDDAFARRSFSPYHSIVFDDIIPDEMRVTDIKNVLKSLGFADIADIRIDTYDPDRPEWFLTAKRRLGPDEMDLWIYVEGTRHVLEREQIMGDGRVKTKEDMATGQIRLYMLGRLPREHQEMTREMNALQKELRDRYQHHMAWRR